MKKTNLFKLIAIAIICCISSSLSAQTLVTDSLSFANAMADLQSPAGSTGGTGGVIQLNAAIVLRPWKQTYTLASTVTAPIEINTQQYSITVSGTSVTADSTILLIGNNLNIHGTSTVLTNLNRGIIRISGSQISSTTTVSGTTTVSVGAGWIFMSGGTVSINATGVVNAYALGVINNFALVLRGGTISAIGDNTRALSLTDNVTPTAISGATITANGNGSYGIQSLGANSLTIGDNMTITTNSTGGTDAALVGGGATSRIVVLSTVANLTLTSSNKYKLDNAGSAVIDLRGLTLTASPVDGSILTYPSNNVTLTASGNASSATCGIYYAFVTIPTIASPNIVSGGNIAATSPSTVLKASIGKNGFIDATVYTFNYTVNNLPAGLPINVSTFADLQGAYTTSLSASDTTRIKLLANITNTSAFTLTPDATHPIVIDANNFTLITGANLTLGGALRVYSTTTTGIVKIAGAFTTTISGGTYTVYGNAPIIFANSGSLVDNVNTKLYLSNSTFNVYGTSNAASIVKFVTSNGNLVSITNCTLNATAKAQAINCIGPLNISLSNSNVNIGGSDATSIAIYYAPTNAAPNTLTISGLTANMTAGKVMSLGGTKALNTIVKDLTVSSGTPTLYSYTPGTGGTLKFYDFRAFTPTVNVTPGSYLTQQTVTPSLTATSVAAVDAASATMVYTTDGTDPIAASTAYSAPIVIAATTTLKVAALKDGFVGKPGVFAYTIGTSGTQSIKDGSGISVFPTTVDGILMISQVANQVQVMDLAGKSLITKSNVNTVNLSAIHSGVYLVKVEMADKQSKTFKIVKK